MLNKFLTRLPNEDNIAYHIPYDRETEDQGGQTYPTPEGLFRGEQFFFAFETDEFSSLDTAMGQTHIDVTLPMEIATSSIIDFKVGDKVIFYNRVKLITGVSIIFTTDDITIGVGFTPTIKRHYTRLTLS
jgi:hypothetical protein